MQRQGMVQEGCIPPLNTLEELLMVVRAQFIPLDARQSTRDRLAKLTQTESVSGYLEVFLHTILAIPGIREDEKVDRYTRGLKPAAQQEVRLQNCVMLDDAMRVAGRVDATYRAYQGAGHGCREADGAAPMELAPVQEFRGQCYSCNQYGHRAADCPTALACGRGRGRGRGRGAGPGGNARQVNQLGEAAQLGNEAPQLQ